MRHVYVDEAGISQNGVEPFLFVVAAITNPDQDWHKIVNYYNDLARQYFPDYDPDFNGNFVFHAKDVWHGSGAFERKTFSIQERMRIFQQLAQAPSLLGIPICYGVVEKDLIPNSPYEPDKLRQKILHGFAYAYALQSVDSWMEERCPGEVAMITAEDTQIVKEALQLFHSSPQGSGLGWAHEAPNKFVTRSIVDAIKFSIKERSPIMQMADHCAFILRRGKTHCQYIGRYLSMIEPALFEVPEKKRRQVYLRGVSK